MAERGWSKLRKAFDGWLDRSIKSGRPREVLCRLEGGRRLCERARPRAQRYDGPIDYMIARRPGTHHLTVNSEGVWTIKVVTAP